MVAHPDEDGRQGADQRHRALAKDAVGVARGRLAEQARQHLADRVGIADRERVEPVRILDARGDHEIEAEDIVLASEPPGERQNLAVKLVVGLAVDDHEARGVGQRIDEERQERRRLARAGRSRHGRMLTAILEGDPELAAVDVLAKMDRTLRHARPTSLRRGMVPVAHARRSGQAKRQGDAPAHHEPGIEERGRRNEVHGRWLDEHQHGAAGEQHAGELAHHRRPHARGDRTNVAQALRARPFEPFLRPVDFPLAHHRLPVAAVIALAPCLIRRNVVRPDAMLMRAGAELWEGVR